HADVLEIEAQDTVLDDLHAVDEVGRDLEVDPGLLDDPADLAEAQHERLLAGVHDEDRRVGQEGGDERRDAEVASASHWPAPWAGATEVAAGACGCDGVTAGRLRCSWSSGR